MLTFYMGSFHGETLPEQERFFYVAKKVIRYIKGITDLELWRPHFVELGALWPICLSCTHSEVMYIIMVLEIMV